jgi:hypothetical protein
MKKGWRVEGEDGGRPCLYRSGKGASAGEATSHSIYSLLQIPGGYTSLKRKCRIVVFENYILTTTR